MKKTKENERKKALEFGLFTPFSSALFLAGAEGLEPSARGFGAIGHAF